MMKFLYSIGNFLSSVGTFFRQFTWIDDAVIIVKMMYDKWVAPVVNFFAPVVKRIAQFYVWAFQKMAFKNGEVSHAKAAGIAVPVLLVSTWFTVFTVIPETMDYIRDGAGVLTEREVKGVYLTGAGPVAHDTTETLFMAKGCPELPCTEDNANYYHIRENSVKSTILFFTKGTVYYPEEVEAAIPDQLSKCDITVQWFRWRLFRVYNVLSEVSCMPLHENE
jgi:hypothetical protein